MTPSRFAALLGAIALGLSLTALLLAGTFDDLLGEGWL